MDEIIERCAGLDVHQATVVACVLVPGRRRRAEKEVRSFRTMTKDLMALRDWLTERGVTHVGMESTGIYWVPVYRVLEGHFELIVGNASHIKNVPGRKTDVKDSEWIADLVRHGLIRRSFVPPPAIRELRELTRFRRKKSQGQATVAIESRSGSSGPVSSWRPSLPMSSASLGAPCLPRSSTAQLTRRRSRRWPRELCGARSRTSSMP
jgi:transposase